MCVIESTTSGSVSTPLLLEWWGYTCPFQASVNTYFSSVRQVCVTAGVATMSPAAALASGMLGACAYHFTSRLLIRCEQVLEHLNAISRSCRLSIDDVINAFAVYGTPSLVGLFC